ncbi:MAG: hypothetical protein PHD67_02615 [Oscillospiraceae bacterium]|nr:hypothetical protein [Oscillospiraceae bacterium]
MDIYQYFAQKLHCQESDLRLKPGLIWSRGLVEAVPESLFSLNQWNEFLSYLSVGLLSASSVREAKEALVGLKCPARSPDPLSKDGL